MLGEIEEQDMPDIAKHLDKVVYELVLLQLGRERLLCNSKVSGPDPQTATKRSMETENEVMAGWDLTLRHVGHCVLKPNERRMHNEQSASTIRNQSSDTMRKQSKQACDLQVCEHLSNIIAVGKGNSDNSEHRYPMQAAAIDARVPVSK
jgi:hypothetical protein